MKTLQDFLHCVATHSRSPLWETCTDRIKEENLHFLRLINKKGVSIYGANTLVGHRDSEHVSLSDLASMQEDILNTHAIGHSPFYSEHTVRCITYAKLYSWSSGHSGVSLQLFNALAELATSEHFNPAVPVGHSYSSGDVVPAAHWAREVLSNLKKDYQYTAQPGETMALINGSFVHLGYGASLVGKLRECWSLFIASSVIVSSCTKANPSNFHQFPNTERKWTQEAVSYVRSSADRRSAQANTQDPVSIRAIPQVIDTLCDSIENFMMELDHALSKPSGNPLFDINSDSPLSQASFLSPAFTVKTEGVIESILFTMWSMVGRVNYWLSGQVEGIPKDAENSHSSLGLIQYPKIMMAELEKVRMSHGRRVFASGSQTSYGTEDLWTNGVLTLGQLDELLNSFFEFCAYEIYIASYIARHHHAMEDISTGMLDYCEECTNVEEVKEAIKRYTSEGGLSSISAMFPK